MMNSEQVFRWENVFVKLKSPYLSKRAYALYAMWEPQAQRDFGLLCDDWTRRLTIKIAVESPEVQPKEAICTATFVSPAGDLLFVGVLNAKIVGYSPYRAEVELHVVLPDEVFWRYGLTEDKWNT